MTSLPPFVWIALAAVLGLLVGSFLNVVILRLPDRMAMAWRRDAREILDLEAVDEPKLPGIVREPSHCPTCKHPLAWYDNVPVAGWLMLKGKCRYCKTPISKQYPIVEALTGILSAVVVWKFGPTPAALAALGLTWALIAASGIDARIQILPDQINYPLLWTGLALCLIPGWQPIAVSPAAAIIGALAGYLSLWSIYWLFKLTTGKEGMGFGDFKLLAALGVWLGPVALLPVVLLSSLLGALIGGAIMVLNKRGRDVPMPFGPYIAGAGWVWLVAGDWLLATYMHLSGLR